MIETTGYSCPHSLRPLGLNTELRARRMLGRDRRLISVEKDSRKLEEGW